MSPSRQQNVMLILNPALSGLIIEVFSDYLYISFSQTEVGFKNLEYMNCSVIMDQKDLSHVIA